MRIGECLGLRVQYLRFDDITIFIADGKGGKDRVSVLPETVVSMLRRHLESVRALYEADLRRGYGEAYVPPEVAHRVPDAGTQWGWQFVFPRMRLSPERTTGRLRRHPLDDQTVQRSVRDAARIARVDKPVTCHSFRHAFATHLIQAGTDIRTVQTLLGHPEVSTTMIYTHVMPHHETTMRSPLDEIEDPGTRSN